MKQRVLFVFACFFLTQLVHGVGAVAAWSGSGSNFADVVCIVDFRETHDLIMFRCEEDVRSGAYRYLAGVALSDILHIRGDNSIVKLTPPTAWAPDRLMSVQRVDGTVRTGIAMVKISDDLVAMEHHDGQSYSIIARRDVSFILTSTGRRIDLTDPLGECSSPKTGGSDLITSASAAPGWKKRMTVFDIGVGGIHHSYSFYTEETVRFNYSGDWRVVVDIDDLDIGFGFYSRWSRVPEKDPGWGTTVGVMYSSCSTKTDSVAATTYYGQGENVYQKPRAAYVEAGLSAGLSYSVPWEMSQYFIVACGVVYNHTQIGTTIRLDAEDSNNSSYYTNWGYESWNVRLFFDTRVLIVRDRGVSVSLAMTVISSPLRQGVYKTTCYYSDRTYEPDLNQSMMISVSLSRVKSSILAWDRPGPAKQGL